MQEQLYLVTGGFDASDEVKKLADELELPIISSSYDSFTVATMLNRAIYDQLIEKDILLAVDIVTPLSETVVMSIKDTVKDFNNRNKKTGHLGYPVTNLSRQISWNCYISGYHWKT